MCLDKPLTQCLGAIKLLISCALNRFAFNPVSAPFQSCLSPALALPMNVMNRRMLLLGLGAAALGLAGCRRATSAIQVSLLARALPPQLLSRFRSATPETEISLFIAPSLKQLFTDLQQQVAQPNRTQRPSLLKQLTQAFSGAPPETVQQISMLGDYWLSGAIAQGLIQPLPVEQWQGWANLAPQWQNMVKRDRQGQPAANGEVWGAPYRWGATIVAYRKDEFRKLGWTPTDWADLWRPELKDKISLLDQPRETIGLTLKKLKQSYNAPNLESVPDLAANLAALHQQAKLYSSTDYLQPLLRKDIWVAVGWSTDILPLLERETDLGFFVPQSGTALWSDLWVLPAIASSTEPQRDETEQTKNTLNQQWVEFWWKPEIAQALTQFTDALSPALKDLNFSADPNNADPDNADPKRLLWPNQPWFERSESLEPLSSETLAQHQRFWQQMRSGARAV